MEDRKWIFSYFPNSDWKSMGTMQLTALEEFGETGEYTKSECVRIRELIHTLEVPKPEEWDDFVKKTNIKIKQLLNGKNNTEEETA